MDHPGKGVYSLLLAGGAMPLHELQGNTGAQTGSLKTDLPALRSRRRILSIARKNRPAEKGLTENLSSALRAADTEFGQILNEVDEISRLLKSDHPDTQTIRVAAHPAVWCTAQKP